MNSLTYFCIFSAFIAVGFSEDRITYDGYRVLRVTPQTDDQRNALSELAKKRITLGLDVIPGIGKGSNVPVSPENYETVSNFLKNQGVSFTETISDVGALIRSQKVSKHSRNGKLFWDEYYGLEGIYEFLDEQAALHPSIVTLQSIGTTFEGRELKMIKISNSGETRRAIWIDANIHAREWITGAVCTYLIDQILNGPDPEMLALINDFDFYILPITNPDGFVYTHTTDRYWRKTRSNFSNSAEGCRGCDPNRNFDAFWMENGGASDDPCSNVFAGVAPFSEPETLAVATFLKTIESRLDFYLSLHSAGQYILIPTGAESAILNPIPEFDEYMRIGQLAAEAHLSVHNMIFEPGNIVDLLYVATGSSMDWAYQNLTAKLHFTYELRDKGQFGHLLPPDQILPSCEEFIPGFKVYMRELLSSTPTSTPIVPTLPPTTDAPTTTAP